jgi:hypothetical protein
MRCWAACLGDCDEVGSQEHIISECLYPDQLVKVQGFPWCRDESKEVRIERLTQQVLCKKHNERLGAEVDWASKHSRDALNAAFDLFTVREKLRSRHWSLKCFETDMLLLERWCTKTIINTNHQGGLKYIDDSEPDSPPTELVEFVFGRRRFTDYKGLYMIAEKGTQISMDSGWLHITAKSQNDRLVGAKFILWGVPFYLNLLPTQVMWDSATLMRHGMKYWFQTGDDKGRNVKSHVLTFTYPK